MPCQYVKGKNVDIKVWTDLHSVGSDALTQLRNITALPWVVHHVAAMPDVHFGIGATVGSVIVMKNAVSPAAVGVDIGCGVGAMRTNLSADDLPDSLVEIRDQIESVIPVGFASHDRPVNKAFLPLELANEIGKLNGEFEGLDESVQSLQSRAMSQLGTLGGGNHFIELCLDDGVCSCMAEVGVPAADCSECKETGSRKPRVWLMLHSGSRNIGKTLAEVHMRKAKNLSHNAHLPDPDLAAFLKGTPEMEAYRRDLYWAQRYAFANRRVMFALYEMVLSKFFPHVRFEKPILCHHNYVAEEVHFGEEVFVTRKGAIRARRGDLGIIPGSMGTKSYIVRGLGNPESFESASHGAGRKMSRGEAKRKFTQEDLIAQTQGVECRKDTGVIDEIPSAYKDIDEVMRNQEDLVSTVAVLKQVLCVKG